MRSDTKKRRKPKMVCDLFSGELDLSPTGEVQDTLQNTPERSHHGGRELEYAPKQPHPLGGGEELSPVGH